MPLAKLSVLPRMHKKSWAITAAICSQRLLRAWKVNLPLDKGWDLNQLEHAGAKFTMTCATKSPFQQDCVDPSCSCSNLCCNSLNECYVQSKLQDGFCFDAFWGRQSNPQIDTSILPTPSWSPWHISSIRISIYIYYLSMYYIVLIWRTQRSLSIRVWLVFSLNNFA